MSQPEFKKYLEHAMVILKKATTEDAKGERIKKDWMHHLYGYLEGGIDILNQTHDAND